MFDQADRDIYRYHDGSRERFGDPLAIEERLFRGLEDHDAEALDNQLESKEPAIVYGALAKLLPAARSAFRLAEFDEDTGAGLTREEVLAVLSGFLAWRDEKKEVAGDGPSSSGPTDTPPAST